MIDKIMDYLFLVFMTSMTILFVSATVILAKLAWSL